MTHPEWSSKTTTTSDAIRTHTQSNRRSPSPATHTSIATGNANANRRTRHLWTATHGTRATQHLTTTTVPHGEQTRPPSTVHRRLATTSQRPPPLATAWQLTAHTGTSRRTTLALTTCTPPRTVSVNTCHSASASTTAFSVHWHPIATVRCPSHTTMIAYLDAHCALTHYIKNCLETIQHLKCMLDMHYSFISSPDIPFENSVIEGEYILLHSIHYLHTFWSEGECCNTHIQTLTSIS